MKEIAVRVRTAAQPREVWALLADVTTWTRWAAFDDAALESSAGLGEIRRFRRGRWTTYERVTGFEPERRLVYELVSGIPVRDYVAEVTLEPTARGTIIRWRSTFEPKWFGTGRLLQRGLGRFIAQTARGLALAAEAGSTGQGSRQIEVA